MSEMTISADLILKRMDSFDGEMKKLVELMTKVALMEERNVFYQIELQSHKSSINELFVTARAHEKLDNEEHDATDAELKELEFNFNDSKKKCEAVATKFDSLAVDYHAKKNMAIGVGLMMGLIFTITQYVAADYYTSWKLAQVEAKQYKERNDAEKAEMQEQLKMITQQLRSMKK